MSLLPYSFSGVWEWAALRQQVGDHLLPLGVYVLQNKGINARLALLLSIAGRTYFVLLPEGCGKVLAGRKAAVECDIGDGFAGSEYAACAANGS